jgi:hypothetical protein
VSLIEERKQSTNVVLERLASEVSAALGSHGDRILRSDTCIYVVGSGGRGEMSEHSDIDLFVARVGRDPSDVDALAVRTAIAQATYVLRRPDPSQGGEYLKMHSAESLCERMGTPDDDASNTLTARMLLLLESRSLLGPDAYEELLRKVLDAYWKDEKGRHKDDFQPYVLVNDIVRYWRILLLNYVAKNVKKERELDEKRRDAERGLRSYKLRFSRCMTCFSALAALLAATRDGAVTRSRALEIVRLRPAERLERVKTVVLAAEAQVAELLGLYESFMRVVEVSPTELIAKFEDEDFRHERLGDGWRFGGTMFDLLQELGRDGRGRELLRHMLV